MTAGDVASIKTAAIVSLLAKLATPSFYMPANTGFGHSTQEI